MIVDCSNPAIADEYEGFTTELPKKLLNSAALKFGEDSSLTDDEEEDDENKSESESDLVEMDENRTLRSVLRRTFHLSDRSLTWKLVRSIDRYKNRNIIFITFCVYTV